MINPEFLKNLRNKLNNTTSFPSVYMFKFIVPDDPEKLVKVQNLFGSEAELSYNKSRSGNYICVTGKEVMLNADEVIRRYKKAFNIKKIISL